MGDICSSYVSRGQFGAFFFIYLFHFIRASTLLPVGGVLRSRAHRASGSSRSSHAVGRAAPNGTVLPLRR